jgi:hypothetical protein
MSQRSSIQQAAGYTLIALFSLILVFHLLVVSGIVDPGLVWGGKFHKTSEIIGFEIVSLALNAFFLLVTLRKTGKIRFIRKEALVNGILWGMAMLFLLNTLGNLLSENKMETLIFTPVTLLLSACCILLAMTRKAQKP